MIKRVGREWRFGDPSGVHIRLYRVYGVKAPCSAIVQVRGTVVDGYQSTDWRTTWKLAFAAFRTVKRIREDKENAKRQH